MEMEAEKRAHMEKALEDFKRIFMENEFTDMEIRTKTQTLGIHKTICKARCSALRKMIDESADDTLHFEEYDYFAIKYVICFLYSGHIDILSHEIVFDVYKVAHQLNITEIKANCVSFMANNLSISTFFNVFKISVDYYEEYLFPFVTSFFVENFRNSIITEEWKKLIVAYPLICNDLIIRATIG